MHENRSEVNMSCFELDFEPSPLPPFPSLQGLDYLFGMPALLADHIKLSQSDRLMSHRLTCLFRVCPSLAWPDPFRAAAYLI